MSTVTTPTLPLADDMWNAVHLPEERRSGYPFLLVLFPFLRVAHLLFRTFASLLRVGCHA